MNLQKLTIFKLMLALVLAVLLFLFAGDFVLSMISFIIAFAFLFLLKNNTKELTVDERVHLISEKASRTALQLFVIITMAGGFLLIMADHLGYADWSQSGNTLLYSGSVISLLYAVLWHYYRRQYGG